jgi:geranylgeranyl pyrophosphate synthase
MRASGAGGMVGGQLLDLLGEGRTLSPAELEQIHAGKTGALMAASAFIGGVAAGAAADRLAALEQAGASLGLAFQIMDDVLGVTSSSDVLGKPAMRDVDLAKSTYVVHLGIDGARARARACAHDAQVALESVGLLTDGLRALADSVLERQS